MEKAIQMRIAARDIVQMALNHVRREIWRRAVRPLERKVVLRANLLQSGYPPAEIDALMDRFISSEVAKRVPGATYLSEEGAVNIAPEPGEIIAWCDPLDGTTNALTVFSDFAVVLFFEQYDGVRFEHLGGAIASSDGTVVSWQQYQGQGEVWVDWAGDLHWPAEDGNQSGEANLESPSASAPFIVQVGLDTQTKPRAGVSSRVAAVAATSRHRNDLSRFYDLTLVDDGVGNDDAGSMGNRWLSTLGGNPCIAPLLLGELGAIIEPNYVDKHDAIYLVPLTLAGGQVIGLEKKDDIKPLSFFSENDPGHLMKPFIAFVRDEALDQLRSAEKEG
jgi:hypothetical protein